MNYIRYTFRRSITPRARIREISAKRKKILGENTQEIENLITSQNKGIFKSGEGGGYLET